MFRISFTVLVSVWSLIAAVCTRGVLGLKCVKCINIGPSTQARDCVLGIVKEEYLLECSQDIEYCETRWTIPSGVTKYFGAEIKRDCANDADRSVFINGCLEPTVIPETDIRKEVCFCNFESCNGVEQDSKAAATSSPKWMFLLALLISIVK